VKAEMKKTLGIGLLLLGMVLAVRAQSPAGTRSGAILSLGGLAQAEGPARGEVVREIDDPHTGDRWLLLRNERVPGGPGRLIPAAAHRLAHINSSQPAAGNAEGIEAMPLPVIRAGDRLIVEEHTAVVDAVLEARALSPAVVGAGLDVRLTIGGSMVRAVATGPGRAALETGAGARP